MNSCKIYQIDWQAFIFSHAKNSNRELKRAKNQKQKGKKCNILNKSMSLSFTFCFIVPCTLRSNAVAAFLSFFDSIERVLLFFPCMHILCQNSFFRFILCLQFVSSISISTTVGLMYRFYSMSTSFLQIHQSSKYVWILNAAHVLFFSSVFFSLYSCTFHFERNTNVRWSWRSGARCMKT